MPAIKLIVVYRAAVFERHAPELLGSQGTEEFVDFIAAHPLAGEVIRGTGGMRKVRWSRPGMGKRGGVRVIYYYHNDAAPVGLFTVYGKGTKDDLTDAEKSAFRQIIAGIKREFDRTALRTKPNEAHRHDRPQTRPRGPRRT